MSFGVAANRTAASPRLQIELSSEKLSQLEELMADTGLATKKDLVNNALTLLTWAVREAQKGRVIVSLDEDGKQPKEILLPALNHVASGRLR